MSISSRSKFAIFAAAFVFRVAFGLFSNMDFEDQKQIYLIGLKYYATGLWPYFGPDVQNHVQIPGALQGLVAGIPLTLLRIPESPFLLVNLLSFAAICLFGWYLGRRIPTFPRWLLWCWLFTAPWLLNISTNVYNVSYVLPGSVLFFVGFFESVPSLSLGLLPFSLCNVMMGFSLFWIAQFHLSYPILAPFIIVSAYFQIRSGRIHPLKILLLFLLGALPPAALLLPTYFHYGFHEIGEESQRVLAFHASNLKSIPTILARYLSLASCEVPRFLGDTFAKRMEFMRNLPWAAPFTLIALGLGLVQPLLMLALGFRKNHPQREWNSVRTLTLLTFMLICVSFLFTVKDPRSHTFYLVLPVVMLYAFYCVLPWSSNAWFLNTAKLLLVCNLVFHVALAMHNYRNSSFFTYRSSVVEALQTRDYRLVGERRWDAQ